MHRHAHAHTQLSHFLLHAVTQPNEMHISINGKAAGTVNGKEVPQVQQL